ncbi:transposase [Burkholderia pseudomallei]|nr:transposase [Burkholderia pseudomallei]
MLAIREKVNISERRACRLVGLSRSVLHYDAKPDHENEVLAARLVKLAHERRRFGYRRLHALVEREGTQANHKRIYRLYREAGLAVRRRRKRHGVMIEREQLALPGAPNEVWSIDFVMDALSNGRRVKCLTVVDDFTKEAVDIVVCGPLVRPKYDYVLWIACGAQGPAVGTDAKVGVWNRDMRGGHHSAAMTSVRCPTVIRTR